MKPLGRELSITGMGLGRFSESQANPTLAALGLDIDYVAGDWSLMAGYRHEAVRHGPEYPEIAQLAVAAVTYTARIGRSSLILRGRLENTLHSTGGPWRARIRTEYRWAVRSRGPVSYAFVNDEEFWEVSTAEWVRNRFQTGLDLGIGARLSLLVFYQRQVARLPVSSRIDALGVTLRIWMN